MALLSLGMLLIAIILGFSRGMNTGLVCIAFALPLARIVGIPDKAVIAGFNYSMFLMLLGVTYLFGLAQINGTLELLAQKVVALTGKRVALIPIVIYAFSVFLAAIGPGCIPTMAIMMVFSMALANEMKIDPTLLSALVVLGGSGGGVSPLAPTGIIGVNLCSGFGLENTGIPFLVNGVLSTAIYGLILYVALKGYKRHTDKELHLSDLPAFNRKQRITLVGIAALVLMVLALKVNVGLAGFLVAAFLSFCRVADEGEALKKVPWGTLLLVTGVGVLMNLIIKLGGIKMLSAALTALMTEGTAPAIMACCAGAMSWFSSTSGVVMPTLIPTIPGIMAELPGINPTEIATALSMASHTGGISPISTGGGLALASYTALAGVSPEEQHKLFVKMFTISVIGVIAMTIMAGIGVFRWLI